MTKVGDSRAEEGTDKLSYPVEGDLERGRIPFEGDKPSSQQHFQGCTGQPRWPDSNGRLFEVHNKIGEGNSPETEAAKKTANMKPERRDQWRSTQHEPIPQAMWADVELPPGATVAWILAAFPMS